MFVRFMSVCPLAGPLAGPLARFFVPLTAAKKKNIIPSMTESYDPYANAIAERVNGILKQEFLLEEYGVDMKTMKSLVKDAVRIYNTQRPHWSCYMKTPEQMHDQTQVKIRSYKKANSSKVIFAAVK